MRSPAPLLPEIILINNFLWFTQYLLLLLLLLLLFCLSLCIKPPVPIIIISNLIILNSVRISMSPTFACTSPVSHLTYHTSTTHQQQQHQRTHRTTRLFAARLGKSWFNSHDDNRIRMSSLPLPLQFNQSILALLPAIYSLHHWKLSHYCYHHQSSREL